MVRAILGHPGKSVPEPKPKAEPAPTPGVEHIKDALDEVELALRSEIFDALEVTGVSTVMVEYSGSNDEGTVDQITSDGKLTSELKCLLTDFCWDTLVCWQHDGFWDGDPGGQGTMTFNVAERRIFWTHQANVITTEDTDYEV